MQINVQKMYQISNELWVNCSATEATETLGLHHKLVRFCNSWFRFRDKEKLLDVTLVSRLTSGPFPPSSRWGEARRGWRFSRGHALPAPRLFAALAVPGGPAGRPGQCPLHRVDRTWHGVQTHWTRRGTPEPHLSFHTRSVKNRETLCPRSSRRDSLT